MTTIRLPIDVRNPRVTSLAGNAFFAVEGLTAWDAGRWEMIDAVESRIYGVVPIPKNVAGTPAGKIILSCATTATANEYRLEVLVKAVADAESLNPASLTAIETIDVTAPGTARLRKDTTFPASGSMSETLTADDLLIVEIIRHGEHANDDIVAPLYLYAALLQIDL